MLSCVIILGEGAGCVGSECSRARRGTPTMALHVCASGGPDLRSRVWGLKLRVWGLGVRVQGVWVRVEGAPPMTSWPDVILDSRADAAGILSSPRVFH